MSYKEFEWTAKTRDVLRDIENKKNDFYNFKSTQRNWVYVLLKGGYLIRNGNLLDLTDKGKILLNNIRAIRGRASSNRQVSKPCLIRVSGQYQITIQGDNFYSALIIDEKKKNDIMGLMINGGE